MRFPLKKTLGILFAVLLIPMSALSADSSAEIPDKLYVQDFFDGTALDLTQYQGKAVFINYFTEWCPICMDEMPDIKLAYDTYDPDSLVILLVHPWDGEDASNSASVVSRFGLDGITVIEDTDFALANAVGIPGYPTSIFVDQGGYLYYAIPSKIDTEFLTILFDDMGVPVRESVSATADTTTTSSPED